LSAFVYEPCTASVVEIARLPAAALSIPRRDTIEDISSSPHQTPGRIITPLSANDADAAGLFPFDGKTADRIRWEADGLPSENLADSQHANHAKNFQAHFYPDPTDYSACLKRLPPAGPGLWKQLRDLLTFEG
jgi:hypothetical protein